MNDQQPDYTEMDGQALAVERTRLAAERNSLARQRTEYARRRTRLSNKRTFLAWSRTALAVMAFGFFLERVDVFITFKHLTTELHRQLTLLGVMAFVAGPLLMILAAWRYIRLERSLGSRWGDMLIVPELTVFILLIGFTLYHVFI